MTGSGAATVCGIRCLNYALPLGGAFFVYRRLYAIT